MNTPTLNRGEEDGDGGMGGARPGDFGSAFHSILVSSTLSCLAAKKANWPKEMPKLTTRSELLPISHRSRSAGG